MSDTIPDSFLLRQFMTDEDVGTVVGNWVSHAEVKVMSAKLVPTSTTAGHASSSGSDSDWGGGGAGQVAYDEAGRFLVGPYAPGDPSMWSGLCLFENQSYALWGHAQQSWTLGPLEER